VTVILERWIRIWNSQNEQVYAQFLQLLHQLNVLKTEETVSKFFKTATELCVDACLKSQQRAQQQQQAQQPGAPDIAPTALNYTVIDALSRLFLLLVRLADKDPADVTGRVNLLSRILGAVGTALLEDHEVKRTNKQNFDQRPYHRLLANLLSDLGVPEPKQEPNPALLPVLSTFAQTLSALQPSVAPGFAFAWLELVSHRCFMPNVLLMKDGKGWPLMHRLPISLLAFLQPFLKTVQLTDAIRKLFKGTLRMLLVLLHDFPEFLCEYHLTFCDYIPPTCVQLRNLVLSAFPRAMRLPDPFTPNLKVDLLPEINQSPRIRTDYTAELNERGIRQRLDAFLTSRQPANFLQQLPSVLMTGPNGSYNLPLMTSLVVYVGANAIMQLQTKQALQTSAAMDVYQYLVRTLDPEGRYHLLNAIANQLRYPNNHTHYFSCVMLFLFAEAGDDTIKEQITRVLLERLIVHRPHPVSFRGDGCPYVLPACSLTLRCFRVCACVMFLTVGPVDHVHRAHQEPSLRVLEAAVHSLRPGDRARV
jgi:CCR4-NOT transcription complex subunit 1